MNYSNVLSSIAIVAWLSLVIIVQPGRSFKGYFGKGQIKEKRFICIFYLSLVIGWSSILVSIFLNCTILVYIYLFNIQNIREILIRSWWCECDADMAEDTKLWCGCDVDVARWHGWRHGCGRKWGKKDQLRIEHMTYVNI